MKNKLLAFLRQYSSLYSLMRKTYWKIRDFQAHFFGTKIQEKKWQNRRVDMIQKWFSNINDPHRQFLIEKISKFYPFAKVLEIGCGYGPNFYLLAKCFTEVEFTGIDINPSLIHEGNKWLNKENIPNIKLLVGKADQLQQFSDKSFDVIFTDAVLIYIGPDKIKKLISQMIRVARRALVFVEWHQEKEDHEGFGIYHFGHWNRNYVNLLKQFVPENKIFLTKLPKEKWPVKDWSELGYIVEVTL